MKTDPRNYWGPYRQGILQSAIGKALSPLPQKNGAHIGSFDIGPELMQIVTWFPRQQESKLGSSQPRLPRWPELLIKPLVGQSGVVLEVHRAVRIQISGKARAAGQPVARHLLKVGHIHHAVAV